MRSGGIYASGTKTETTEASVDYSLYYTYEDVEKVVSYLTDAKVNRGVIPPD